MQTPLVLTFPLKETHLVTRKRQLHMMQTPLVLTFPVMETHLVTLKGMRLLPELPTVTWASMGPPQTLVKPAPRHKTLLTALAFWEEDEHVVLRADHGHDGACNSSWARLVVVFPGHFARLNQNAASVFCCCCSSSSFSSSSSSSPSSSSCSSSCSSCSSSFSLLPPLPPPP